MRFIPTKMHAAMDYLGGALMFLVPMFWLNDPAVPSAAVWTPIIVGAFMLIQGLMTDYEISLANIIPMPVHLGMDALAGLVLLASPWVFGFSETVWLPHVILGIMEIGAALTTKLHRGEPAHHSAGHQIPA